MKSVKEVTAHNCEQIMLSVQPNGDCTASVFSTETKGIAEVVDTSNNADNVQIILVWKNGTKYCISDDENGIPKIVLLKEENSNHLKMERATPNYMPKGFKYLDGSIESKDYRIVDEKGNVFTWVPERTFENGKHVKGFYISTYEISKGADGAPKSIEGAMPWVNITKFEAIEQAEKFGGRLVDEPEWDAICDESAKVVGEYDVYEDSTMIGNYRNRPGSTGTLEKTGKHVICGISNLAGNCYIWTNATYGTLTYVCGGAYNDNGRYHYMADRRCFNPNSKYGMLGFRIVL